ncbi:MAG TPA: class I SAM-dependent methyltransferase [Acidimicrobiia bacterium]|nr:class I SAM-dependent methyltransferase [Acidimicrobiia bacterium]
MGPAASRSFDRAAPFYDATRGLPGAAAAELTALLTAELTHHGRCLEIGVGTGRIALGLHRAGVPMTGVDLSRPMMTVLVDKAGGHVPFPLAQADATALPFPARRFGAAVASHVFHLIPAWETALHELVRVVVHGGRVLMDRGGRDNASAQRAVRARFRAELGGGGHPGVDHGSRDLEDALGALGATARPLPPVRASWTTTLAAMIDGLEAGHWSWTWSLPPEELRGAATRTRAWALDTHGSLDAPIVVDAEVHWVAYDLP